MFQDHVETIHVYNLQAKHNTGIQMNDVQNFSHTSEEMTDYTLLYSE